MFKPMGLRRRTKDKRTEEMLRSAMGEYKVNDKILRDLTKMDWDLPMDIDSALRQIHTGWRVLELLFCEDTIAAEGYRYGETVFLKTHRYRIAKALETDKLFLVRYHLHLLDSIFQAFLGELVGYFGQQEHPLPAAQRRRVQGKRQDTQRPGKDGLVSTHGHGLSAETDPNGLEVPGTAVL
jgi:hypothetical protein